MKNKSYSVDCIAMSYTNSCHVACLFLMSNSMVINDLTRKPTRLFKGELECAVRKFRTGKSMVT